MRISYLTVWAICLDHHSLKRNQLKNIKIFLSFKRASINSNKKIQCQNFLKFLFCSSKRMDHSITKHMPVFLHNLKEVIPCVSIVKVQGKLVFVSQIKMTRKYLQLFFLTRPLKPIIIKSTLSNCHQMRIHFVLGMLHFLYSFFYFLKILVNICIFLLIEGFFGPTRMNSYGGITVLILLAHLMRKMGIFQITCSNQKMITSNSPSSFNHLMSIIFMMFLSIVIACKLMVSQIGSNIIELKSIIFVIVGCEIELLWLSLRLLLLFFILSLLTLFFGFFWVHLFG